MPGASRRELDALIATDRRYFEAGATSERVGPAILSSVRGLSHLGAGCVVHSLDLAVMSDAGGWLGRVEAAARSRGARYLRIYLDGPEVPLDRELAARGFHQRTELAFVGRVFPRHDSRAVTLVALASDDDDAWAAVAKLHRATGIGSGIHSTPPDEWTALMRRRCATPAMDAFIILVDGIAVGSVGVLTADSVLRSKNVVVDRRVRRTGVGCAVLASLGAVAAERGCTRIGAFAVDGSDGASFYSAIGMRVVGAQREWALRID